MQAVGACLCRRDVLKLGASLLAGAMVSPAFQTAAKAQAKKSISIGNMADLTHTISPQMSMWPGTSRPKIDTVVTVEKDGFYGNNWTLWEHTGTHLDSPAHFIKGGMTADKMPLESMIVPLAVVDIRDKAGKNPDAEVTPDDILAWEKQHGRLPDGAAVFMRSGWDARIGDETKYQNMDASKVMHFPGFAPAAAELLTKERKISGIGVDTLSQDFGASKDFKTHVVILGAGKWGLENVANLANVPPAGATLILGSLKIDKASGGPVRLMAVW